MAYQKTVWKDQDVENPRTYIERDNGDGTVTLLDAFGEVTELGTPVNAKNMNHIEDGIEEVDSTTVHKTGNETISGIKTFNSEIDIGVGEYKRSIYRHSNGNFVITMNKQDNSGWMSYIQMSTAGRVVINAGDDTATDRVIALQGKSATAPTPSAGDNSTKIATTAFVQSSVSTRTTPSDVSAAISTTLAALYPVGSIYITTQNTGSCPIAGLISGSQWELVGVNCALWGASAGDVNRYIPQGLPNITGAYNARCLHYSTSQGAVATGALYQGDWGEEWRRQNAGGTDGSNTWPLVFDASRSNSIYGASAQVQPPAYTVNVWRRTA